MNRRPRSTALSPGITGLLAAVPGSPGCDARATSGLRSRGLHGVPVTSGPQRSRSPPIATPSSSPCPLTRERRWRARTQAVARCARCRSLEGSRSQRSPSTSRPAASRPMAAGWSSRSPWCSSRSVGPGSRSSTRRLFGCATTSCCRAPTASTRSRRRRVPAPRPEPLVGADGLDPKLARLVDECVPDLRQAGVGVVEPPGVARVAEGVGKVGEHLPRGDRVPARVRLHLVEVCLQRPVVRQRLRVEQNRVPAAGELGRVARLLHDRRRERTPLRRDRKRRQGDHVRVAAQKEVLQEHLARKAGAGIVLAAVHLREHRAEERLPARRRHQVVLEVVPLDVEDELLAGERRPSGILILARLGRDGVAAARRVARVAEASLEGQQGRWPRPRP